MATIQESINDQFTSIYGTLGDVSKQTRTLGDTMKTLQRTLKTASKQVRASQKKNQEKMILSNDLKKFLSLEQGTTLTKAEVMKSVSSYIKEHNLQLEDNKRKFKPDTKMTKVFSMKKGTEFTFVEINKHVSGHLSKVVSAPTPTTSA